MRRHPTHLPCKLMSMTEISFSKIGFRSGMCLDLSSGTAISARALRQNVHEGVCRKQPTRDERSTRPYIRSVRSSERCIVAPSSRWCPHERTLHTRLQPAKRASSSRYLPESYRTRAFSPHMKRGALARHRGEVQKRRQYPGAPRVRGPSVVASSRLRPTTCVW